MMKVHKKKKDLEAPDYARNHWESNKGEMTLLLRDCNFCKDPVVPATPMIEFLDPPNSKVHDSIITTPWV